jgi:DNA-binding CsgD family transcriptional regulator
VAVARAAAVLGERGTFPDVAVLARLAKDDAAAAVERLQAAEVLVADRALAFTHPLVRAAVLDELGAADTEEWQLRAARLLADRAEGSTRAAAHLLHAAPVGEPWAGELLRRAAVDASARGAPESAIAFLERAMSEPMDTPTRALTTLQLGIAGFAANDARALEWLASATRAATDSALWQPAWTATVYVSVIWKAPLPDDLRIRELPQLSDDAHLALAAMKANSFMTGVWEDAIVAPIPQPADPQSSDREAAVTWFGGAAWRGLCDGKPAVTVIELADRALALPPGGHLLDYYRHSFAAMALVFAGEPERGIRHLDDGVEFATRSGFQPEVHRYVALRACGHALIGNLREAAADLAMTGPSEEFGWVLGAPVRFGVEIDVLREQGRLADADSVAAAHPVDDAETSRDLMLAYLVLAVANLRLTQRRYDAALVEYRRLARLLDERGVPRTPVYPWRLGAARALAALGREEEALELARAQLDDARQLGAPMWIGASLRALGSVVPGPSGTELLREAVEVLAGTPFRLEYAHALCELGTRLRRGRQIVDAREPLRRSLDLAERCGADALVERATTELLATGARPRRRAVTGVDALTPAESRVARLAAAGSSNAEIAQTLFVSRKTVEKHLGNAYAKLAVTSRAELAETPGVSDRNGGVLPH